MVLKDGLTKLSLPTQHPIRPSLGLGNPIKINIVNSDVNNTA
jgi:hypothetical protein